MASDYNSDDIKVLSDIEHVRKRTQIYLGSMNTMEYRFPVFGEDSISIESASFIPAVLKSFGEIVDNSIDEFNQVYSKRHKLVIEAIPDRGAYIITDNGRGIPIDMHESQKYTPEVVLANLRSGRNFDDEKQAGVIGQNGVGSACVNFVSKEFLVKINRDNKEYTQIFEQGCQEIGSPIITKMPSSKTGTSIQFQLDDTIFSSVSLPESLVREKARGLAFTNPSIQVEYNGEQFKYKHGLEEIISTYDKPYHVFKYKNGDKIYEFHVVLGVNQSENEEMFTWVNSSLLFDGGICNTQFINSFTDRVISQLEKESKKLKCKVIKNDVKEGLLIFGNLKLSDPEFDSQSKTRLVAPSIKKEIEDALGSGWSKFVKDHKNWFEDVLNRAYEKYHAKSNKKAIDDHLKSSKKRIDGFKDATSKSRQQCCLFITEGNSASAEIGSVRDPKIHAAFALTGKVNNVYGVTPAQLLKMGKLTNLLSIIGLTPGVKAIPSKLNFGKIYIATDADPDGADIFSLLVNMFHTFWPELFEQKEPIINRLLAPNLVAYNKKNRVHFPDMVDFLKHEKKYKNHTIVYYKGLGSMVKEDWKLMLNDLEKYSIPMLHDDMLSDTIQLLFSDDANSRKEWLSKS